MTANKTKPGRNHPDTSHSTSNLAGTYWTQGRFKEAQQLQTQFLDLPEDRARRRPFFNTRRQYQPCDNTLEPRPPRRSERLTLEVLEARKAKLRDEHPSALDSEALLVPVCRAQGGLADAEMLEECVLQVRKEKLGEDHPHTLCSMGNLAVTYNRQDFAGRASALMKMCYEGHEKALDSEHPHTVR